MANLMKEIPEMKKWKSEAEASTFFGFQLDELSRDELLGVIGWWCQESKRMIKSHEQELSFYRDIGAI